MLTGIMHYFSLKKANKWIVIQMIDKTVTKKTEEQYIELLTDESVKAEQIAKLLVNKDKIITKQTHDLSKILQKYDELDTKLYEKDFFEVENATDYTEDSRVFKNGLCVFNNRLGMAYSVTEIVEVLNNMTNAIHEPEKETKKLKENSKISEDDEIDDFTLHCVNMCIKELMDFNHKMLNDAIDRGNVTEALIFENRELVLVELGMKLSELGGMLDDKS